MRVLAVDPGNEESAWVSYDGASVYNFGKQPNDEMRITVEHVSVEVEHVVIEMIASYGMPVGREVFETCVWIGRFLELSPVPVTLVTRHDVKMHLCGTKRAKDGNVRQALIDKFGKPGTKKNPGTTYGIAGDVWSALAVAVTWWETMRKDVP